MRVKLTIPTPRNNARYWRNHGRGWASNKWCPTLFGKSFFLNIDSWFTYIYRFYFFYIYYIYVTYVYICIFLVFVSFSPFSNSGYTHTVRHREASWATVGWWAPWRASQSILHIWSRSLESRPGTKTTTADIYIYILGGASASLIVRPKTAPRTIYKIYRTIYKSSGLL